MVELDLMVIGKSLNDIGKLLQCDLMESYHLIKSFSLLYIQVHISFPILGKLTMYRSRGRTTEGFVYMLSRVCPKGRVLLVTYILIHPLPYVLNPVFSYAISIYQFARIQKSSYFTRLISENLKLGNMQIIFFKNCLFV